MTDYTGFSSEDLVRTQNEKKVTSAEQIGGRSWERSDVATRLEEVRNNRGMIESILQDLDEEFENLPSHEELKEEWSAYLERVNTDNKGRPKKLPRAFSDVKEEKIELMIRQAVWQARAKELEAVVRKKLGPRFDKLLEEYRTASSYETLEDELENKAEHFATDKVNEKTTRLESKINQVEKLGQAIREERRADRETIKELASAADGVDEEEIKRIIEEAAENGLEQFITSQGVFKLDEELRSQDEKNVEREEAAEKAASDAVEEVENDEDGSDVPLKDDDGTYLIKDVGFQERVDRLCEMWSEERIPERIDDPDDGITKSEIADMVDMSQAALFNDGLIDKIAAEEDVFLKTP